MNQSLLKKLAALGLPKGVDPAEFVRLRMLYRPLRTRLSLVSVVGVLGLIGGILLIIFFSPLRAWEMVPIIAFGCSAAALLITRALIATVTTKLPTDAAEASSGTLIQRRSSSFYELTGLGKAWQHIADKNLRQSGPVVAIYCFLGLTALLTGAVLTLNQILDQREGSLIEAAVQEKILTHGKHKSKNYYLRIASPAPAWFNWLGDVGDVEDIRVNRNVYDRAIEGTTTVSLVIYDGALGMPWYRLPDNAFGNLSTTTSSTSSLGDKLANEIHTACLWRENFNLATEIGHAPAQDYRREYWPNGALKAEEPLINGVMHGVGQYWFDNGSRYANIPFKQGQKHGIFILHRANGTIEQQLSYKDGQLYGINTWYDENGTVAAAAVYVANNQYFPLRYCNTTK